MTHAFVDMLLLRPQFAYFIAAGCAVMGCTRQPEYPRVVYKQPLETVNPKHVIPLEMFVLQKVDEEAPRGIKLPDQIAALEGLSIQGEIDPTKVATPPHGVLVLFREKKAKKGAVVNSVAQPLSRNGQLLKYDLRLNLPSNPGPYLIELFAMSNDVPLLRLAQGEFQID